MVAIRQILILCLLMALANGSYYKRIHQNVGGLRKLLSGLIHPKLNLRNHHQRHLGRFQDSHLNSNKFTRSDVPNDIPSEVFGYDLFDPISFSEQRFDSESQELGDYSGNSMATSNYCEENHKNEDFKNPRSEEYDISEEYNANYVNERIYPDRFESHKKLKAFLCSSVINKPEELNIDFIKEKNKQETHNEKENDDFAYFSNFNSESNISNKLKTNNDAEKVVTTSQTDYSDYSNVNINRNPQFRIVPEGIEQPDEDKNKIMTQYSHNAPNVISDQVFDNSGNNQALIASNIIPKAVPSLLPLNYPTYLSNLFIPNISPVQNIPPAVNPINNGAQYSKQPGTTVSNDNMIPFTNIALTNVDSGITNSYTFVAIPNNGYSSTNGLGLFNSALYQNPYSKQQSYYVIQLKNGQNALLPSKNVQMFVRKQNLEKGDGQSTIKPGYDQIIVPSNGKKLSTQDNATVYVSNNVQQITSDGQNLSQDEKVLGGNEQTIPNNVFVNGEIVVPANAQGVQKEGQKPLQFSNIAASALSSSGDRNSLLIFKDETDRSSSDENDKMIFI